MADQLRVDQIICFTRLQGEDLEEPMWVRVTHVTADQFKGDVVLRGTANYKSSVVVGNPNIQYDLNGPVRRQVYPPDDVPDEFFAQQAKRALLGRAN